MDHSTAQETLGAYALNAVDADEAAELDRHLLRCAECREELDQHLEVAALMSVTERSAPAEIWGSIADEVRNRPPRPAADPRTAPEGLPPLRSNVIPLRNRWLRPMAIAAAFTLVSAAAAVQSVRLSDANASLADERATVSSLTRELTREPLQVAADRAMLDPSARQLSLTSESAPVGAVIVLMSDGTGYLAEHSLAPLPADRTYQLWALIDGKVISAGILGSDPGVVPFHIDPEGFEGFAITEEVIGGVAVSENAPVVVGLAA